MPKKLPSEPDTEILPTLPEGAQPHPMQQWSVLSPSLHEAQTVEAERLYLTDGALTFMTGKDIVLAFAPGAWTLVKLLPPRSLVPAK